MCALEGDSAELALAVLEKASSPIARGALIEAVARAAGADGTRAQPVADAVTLLAQMGILVDASAPAPAPMGRVAGRVVVAVTGAIGAVQAPQLVQALLRETHDVRVVMTRSARRFITPRAFAALTHRRVATNMWDGSPDAPAPHVEMAQWADVVVVCPCTATTLARIATGDCSELVSAIATTTRAPVLLVPSMNAEMLRAPLVARNLRTLREGGFFLAHPGHGHEVAEAPRERVMRTGVAADVSHVVRYAALLLAREAVHDAKVPSRVEWTAEYERLQSPADDADLDVEVARALDAHVPASSRVLEIGTGFGAIARGAARRGHSVVATDFAATAIERARAVAPELSITWLVDDVTDSALRSTFDVCIDRACFGCVPVVRRARYLAQVAAWVRPGGVWLLHVHRGPSSTLRAYGFTVDEVRELAAPSFEVVSARESLLSFSAWNDRPAWSVVLRRRAAR